MSNTLPIVRLYRIQVMTAIGTLLIGLAAAGIGMQPAHAGESSNVKQELSETLTAIKNYSADKRDEAVAAGKEMVETLDAHIEALQDKAERTSDSATEATRAKWEETKSGLIKLREKASVQLERMRDSSAEAWSDAKDEFTDAVEKLSDSIEEAGEDLQS